MTQKIPLPKWVRVELLRVAVSEHYPFLHDYSLNLDKWLFDNWDEQLANIGGGRYAEETWPETAHRILEHSYDDPDAEPL